MEINTAELYYTIRKHYSSATYEEVLEGYSLARIAEWEMHEQGKEVRNPTAFCICVVKRFVSSEYRWRNKHVYPDRLGDGAEDWDEVEECRGALGMQSNVDAPIDAERVLQQSPPRYAEVLRRHYLEGETLDQIARDTGATPACMRKRHERALAWARKHLSEDSKRKAPK